MLTPTIPKTTQKDVFLYLYYHQTNILKVMHDGYPKYFYVDIRVHFSTKSQRIQATDALFDLSTLYLHFYELKGEKSLCSTIVVESV
jgi:hypothetical protein